MSIMKLDDFIKNSEELSLNELDADQLKKINGGIGGPVPISIPYEFTAEDAFILTYQECYTC